ncbi:MAG: hypothetical protein C4524_00725 [Candidatus Zixiibacteriota bacterium]|nr:MAG: hypothetical protein C4524_00725 [candidate division Zixibacteria bacterium]
MFDFPPSTPLELHRPLDPESMRMQRTAAQYESRGEYAKSLELYRQLFARFPEYDPFYEGVIRALFASESYEEGLAFVDSLRGAMQAGAGNRDLSFAQRERWASLVVDAGHFAAKMGRSEEAFRRWEELYTLTHPTPNPYFRLMSAMIDSRLPEELDDMVKKARQATGDASLLAASLASYYADRGQADRAIEELLGLMEVQPRQAEAIQRQILGMPDDGQSRRMVEETLQEAKSREAIRLPVVQMLGLFYFRNKEWEKAYAEVREADRLGGSSGEAMLSFAETLNSESEAALALQVLDDAARSHPDLAGSPRARLARGRALVALGEIAAADSVYGLITAEPVLRTVPEQEALMAHARLKLDRLNQPAQARQLVQDNMNRNPRLRHRGDLMLLVGDTWLAQRDLEQARTTYLDASVHPAVAGQPELRSQALINAARADFYLGDMGQAVERLNEAARTNPEGLLANDALELMDLLRGGAQDSLALETFARADLELRLGQRAAAESLYVQVARETQVADLAERALGRLADSQRTAGHAKEALNTLQETLQRYPSSLRAPEVLLKIGEIRERELGDPRGAIQEYEKVLVDYPGSLSAEEARRRIRKLESEKT